MIHSITDRGWIVGMFNLKIVVEYTIKDSYVFRVGDDYAGQLRKRRFKNLKNSKHADDCYVQTFGKSKFQSNNRK